MDSLLCYSYGADILDWLSWSELLLTPSTVKDAAVLQTLIIYQANVTYAIRIHSKESATLSLKRLWSRILVKVFIRLSDSCLLIL